MNKLTKRIKNIFAISKKEVFYEYDCLLGKLPLAKRRLLHS